MPEPLDGLLRVIPAGGIGIPAVAAVPRRRPQVPARPHRLRPAPCCATRGTGSSRSPGEQRIMVVTGRAHRAAVEKQLPDLADKNVVLESRAARLGGRDRPRRRDPRPPRARRHHRLVRRRPRDPGAAAVPTGPCTQAVAAARDGYICTIGIHAHRAGRRLRLHQERRAELVVAGAPEAALVESFVEKPDLDTAKRYLAAGPTSGTRACSSRRADVLLGRDRREPAASCTRA